MNRPIPFIDLKSQYGRIAGDVGAAIQRVLDHGAYILGPEVEELEKRLAAFCGARHAVSCASGTDALVMALMAKGIGPGDAVFVPAFTFVATAEAAALVGATPVFVDVLPDSFNMDPASLEAAVKAAPAIGLRPACVIPVDLFGQPADADAIAAIAAADGLFVISDSAQSFGAAIGERKVGTFGLMTTTSFYPAKPLGCYGDGGAIFTDDDELDQILRSVRNHGQGQDRYDNVRLGINGRLDTIQAAILLQKLAIFPDEIVLRQRIAERYSQGLRDVARIPVVAPGKTSVWAQYTLVVEHRDDVLAALKAEGVPTAVFYPRPLNRQTAFTHAPTAPNGLPVSEHLAGRVLSLPMSAYVEPAEQDRIIEIVRRVLARKA
jgi:dTDP-4-amino-4,6-dideoxygalactose transaminase